MLSGIVTANTFQQNDTLWAKNTSFLAESEEATFS